MSGANDYPKSFDIFTSSGPVTGGAPREPIVANGTLANVGSLGRPPEGETRTDGEVNLSELAFGSLVRPPEGALRDSVPNGPLAPLGSLGRPPECVANTSGNTAHATLGVASTDFADSKGEGCGTANRKLLADPTPSTDHGRVGEPPVTASGSSATRRDPTPCPALVWRLRLAVVKNSSSSGSPRDCLLRYCFASWRAALLDSWRCQMASLLPPASGKAKKKKGKK